MLPLPAGKTLVLFYCNPGQQRGMSMLGVQTSAQKREFMNGKINIGIDSAKDKHLIRIIDLIKLPIESPDSIGA